MFWICWKYHILTYIYIQTSQYAVEGYKEWQAAREAEEKELEELRKANPDAFKEEEENVNKSRDSSNNESSQSTNEDDGKRENIFSKFFDMSVGSKYYEGGFEDKVSKHISEVWIIEKSCFWWALDYIKPSYECTTI